MNKELLERDLKARKPIRTIADETGRSYTAVRYWIKKYGLTLHVECHRYPEYTEAEFRTAVACKDTVAGVLKSLGRKLVGSAYRMVNNEIRRLGLDTSHWVGQSHGRGSAHRMEWSEVLTEKSRHRIDTSRKQRLVQDGLLKNECDICHCKPVWMGKKLVLRLDHISGDNSDNRLENLRLICPNCDSQLATFCGRNANRH